MEDAHVSDRDLKATTDRNKDTRTTAMTIQADLGKFEARPYTVE